VEGYPGGGGEMIEDKEIGEQWRNHVGLKHHGSAPLICDLIQKLVEERTNFYELRGGGEKEVLESFGIDPETWGKDGESCL
jgi:hypothetical protein